jgi:hypothetical protein
LLTLLFQVLETGQWTLRTLGAALASVLSYSIFAKAMQVNLPKGLLTFF